MYPQVCRLNRKLDQENQELGRRIAAVQGPILPNSLVDEVITLKREMELARQWLYEEGDTEHLTARPLFDA